MHEVRVYTSVKPKVSGYFTFKGCSHFGNTNLRDNVIFIDCKIFLRSNKSL